MEQGLLDLVTGRTGDTNSSNLKLFYACMKQVVKHLLDSFDGIPGIAIGRLKYDITSSTIGDDNFGHGRTDIKPDDHRVMFQD